MYIAIITGASSGIGREFALQADSKYTLDEIWLIARREDRLENVKNLINTKVKIIPLDLSSESSYETLNNMLKNNKPSIKLLVNAAGMGKFGTVASQCDKDVSDMIKVNILALTMITKMCLPYMLPNSGIINMASVSGYTSLPSLNVYSASKAYVLHFTEALAKEVESRNIRTTAVCPYWVATEFIPKAQQTAESDAVNNFIFMTYPYPVVNKAFRDNAKSRLVSMFGCTAKIIHFLSKTVPEICQICTWDILRRNNKSTCQ